MTFKKEFQQIILPLFKSSPVIIGLMVLAALLVRQAVNYMTPEYQANGAIKINNLSYSEMAFNLFDPETGAMPKQSENFLTEVEVFQTKDLIRKTLENLDWELSLYRVGKLITVEVSEESPFSIEYQHSGFEVLDKPFYLDYLGNNVFRYRQGGEQDSVGLEVIVGEKLELPGIQFTIHLREAFLKTKPQSLKPGDRFAFQINSLESLVKACSGEQLFVKPVEKDISIIKIYFNHELPDKAQDFVNELMRTYIQEGRESKQDQADETLAYLDSQINDVKYKLQNAESELAFFRTSNHMVNTTLETDATLKELIQLDLQKLDLEMKYSEIERLQAHLYSGNELSDFSPNFAALQDPIFRESYLKAQLYEVERKDLLQKYTRDNPAVANLDEKMREARAFLNESVISTINNLAEKRGEVDATIDRVGTRIKKFPEKERFLVVLEREVNLNESIYNYLMRKRTELAIESTSDLNPHKIIEHAERPSKVASPNKPLLYGLAIFLALLAGMAYAYVRSYFKDNVNSKEELQALPASVLGVVYRKNKGDEDGFSLISGLIAGIEKLSASFIKNQGKLLVTTSMLPGEGKSFTSTEVAKGFAAAGKKVLVVDMDIRKPTLHHNLGVQNTAGFCDILEKRVYALHAIQETEHENLYVLTAGQLQSKNFALLFSRRSLDFIYDFRWHFDVVIVDTPPVGLFEDSLPIMNESTANLFVVRAGYTKKRMLGIISDWISETGVPNLHLVLNDKKSSSKVPGYKSYIKNYYGYETNMGYA